MTKLFRANRNGNSALFSRVDYVPTSAQLFRPYYLGNRAVFSSSVVQRSGVERTFRAMRRNGVALFNSQPQALTPYTPVNHAGSIVVTTVLAFDVGNGREHVGEVAFGISLGFGPSVQSDVTAAVDFGLTLTMTTLPQVDYNAAVDILTTLKATMRGRIAGWEAEPPADYVEWKPDGKPKLF